MNMSMTMNGWQAFFDTSKHAKVHALGAEWFFYIETIAVLLNVRGMSWPRPVVSVRVVCGSV